MPPVALQIPGQAHIQQRRLLIWSLITSSILFCVLLFLGMRWGISVRSDVMAQFWAPILSQKELTVISSRYEEFRCTVSAIQFGCASRLTQGRLGKYLVIHVAN